MKSSGALQVVIILLLVASAASCEVAKDYSNRVFKPTIPQKRSDTTATALKFMQFDNESAVDSIDLKDFANQEMKETSKEVMPKDSIKTEVAIIDNKNISREQPVDATKRGSIRTKKVRQ